MDGSYVWRDFFFFISSSVNLTCSLNDNVLEVVSELVNKEDGYSQKTGGFSLRCIGLFFYLKKVQQLLEQCWNLQVSC